MRENKRKHSIAKTFSLPPEKMMECTSTIYHCYSTDHIKNQSDAFFFLFFTWLDLSFDFNCRCTLEYEKKSKDSMKSRTYLRTFVLVCISHVRIHTTTRTRSQEKGEPMSFPLFPYIRSYYYYVMQFMRGCTITTTVSVFFSYGLI